MSVRARGSGVARTRPLGVARARALGFARGGVAHGLGFARARAGVAAVLCAGVLVAVAACNQASTFSPEGPCVADGRAPGTYPSLEATIPTALEGRPADSVNSGRNCSQAALGTLASHGVTDLRFAGATWADGNDAGTSIALLALPTGALPVAWAEEFYELGARNAKKTDHVTTSRPTFDGVGAVFRVDALNDLSFQSVIVWQDGPLVRVVLVATAVDPGASMAAHDTRLAAALAAAVSAARGGGAPSASA